MKNIILAVTALVALSTASFAKEKDADLKLLRDLSYTLENSTNVNWTDKEEYKQAEFTFRNKTALAFYKQDNELIGFGIRYDKTNQPEIVTEAIKNRYSDWQVGDVIIFIDTEGSINYFAEVQKNNKRVALKITPNGKSSMYARMPTSK